MGGRVDEAALTSSDGASLASLVSRTTAALAARVEGGVLADETCPTPSDHYASTFLALALAVRNGEHDAPRARELVEAWCGGAPRGHFPFNRLALACLHDVLPDLADTATWVRWRDKCPLRDDDPSNNWRLLTAACRVLEGASPERFDDLLAHWTTPAGAFVDGPTAPGDDPVPGGSAPHPWRGSTPIAYHAKATLLAALVQRAHPTPERARQLACMRRWLLAFSDSGRLGGFGRSTSALFGDACAVAVFVDAMGRKTSDHAVCSAALAATTARLESGRRADGLLALTPSGASGASGGWDPYMHLTVYNAYFAGVAAWALRRWQADGRTPIAAARPASLHDEDAGLLARHEARGTALIATRGQPVQSFRADAVDLRYAGWRAFHLRSADGVVRTQAGTRVSVAALRAQPALAGSTPIFEREGRLYGLVEAAHRPVVAVDGARTLVVARGVPQQLHHGAPARWSPGWWTENIDHVLGGTQRRRRALRAPTLAGVEVVAALAVDAAAGRWAHAWWVLGGEHLTWLNPCGHASSGDELPAVAAVVGRKDERELELGRPVSLPSADAQGWARCGARLTGLADDVAWRVEVGESLGRPALLDVSWLGSNTCLATSWARVEVERHGLPLRVH